MSLPMRPDLRLYVIVDPSRAGGHDLADLARAAVRGGATLIQLRDKVSPTRDFVARAIAVRDALRGTGVPLLVNDRIDVALAAEADGVHVGQDDMAAHDARRLLGPRAIIGLTTRSIAEADAAILGAIDYAAIGGVFATTSKDATTAPVGLAGVAAISSRLRSRAPRLPLVAIAGIDAGNAADVVRAGVDGVSVISAVSLAPDPREAARRIRAEVDKALASVQGAQQQ